MAMSRMNLDLNRLNGNRSRTKFPESSDLRFEVERNAFFTVVVFNNELRGALPSSMELIPQNSAALPSKLNSSYQQLVIEKTQYGDPFEFVIRDEKTGFVFFNIEGHQFDYQANERLLNIQTGQSADLERFCRRTRSFDGSRIQSSEISRSAQRCVRLKLRKLLTAKSYPMKCRLSVPKTGTVPGPDVIVGDVYGLAQFGSSSGTQVGLAVGTNSCNFGTENLNWFQLPSNDHPVIPQNLYRMSGGATNDERFEQIGQSSVKHAFTALTQNLCNLGCNGVGGTRLGSGCSDPYSASLNAGPSLGSRAWINPFSGSYPRGDSATPPNNHGGHTPHRTVAQNSDGDQ